MNELRIYLAYRQLNGVNNQAAARVLEQMYNAANPNEDPLVISPAMVSRVRAGQPVRAPKREVVRKAIETHLRHLLKHHDSAENWLSSTLSKIYSDPNVIEILRRYDDRSHRKLRVPLGRKRFSSEDEDLLLGVWQQINFTCVNTGVNVMPQLRSSLKLFHYKQADMITTCLGVKTEWEGVATAVNKHLHVTEKIVGREHSEVAHYVYDKHLVSNQKDLQLLVGFVQVVSHYDFKHMFSGRTVLRKISELDQQFRGKPVQFLQRDSELRDQYCGHFNLPIADMSQPCMREIDQILTRYLMRGDRYLYDVIC